MKLLTLISLLSILCSCEAELLEKAAQLENSQPYSQEMQKCLDDVMPKESDLMKCGVYTTETYLELCANEVIHAQFLEFYEQNVCEL